MDLKVRLQGETGRFSRIDPDRRRRGLFDVLKCLDMVSVRVGKQYELEVRTLESRQNAIAIDRSIEENALARIGVDQDVHVVVHGSDRKRFELDVRCHITTATIPITSSLGQGYSARTVSGTWSANPRRMHRPR